MDRRRSSRLCLKLANSMMLMVGLAILLYSVWMTVVCLRDYQKYHLSWFLWACVGVGAFFCVTSLIGHIGAHRRHGCLLSFYILVVFLILLAEILVAADVFLNDDWDKDFPKDPTHRFDDFVDFADDHDKLFTFLALLILFFQVVSFILAMIVRTMHHHHDNSYRSLGDDHIPIGTPYVAGQHPHMLADPFLDEAGNPVPVPVADKGTWSSMFGGGKAGYPPV